MVISDLSIKRPVLAFVLSALLIVVGVLGWQRLPVRETPRVDAPVVSIGTSYPGASPEVVDNEITERIERTINSIEGIRTIRSRSAEGRSSVNIEFEISRDLDSAASDVRDRIGRIAGNLPEEVDPPEVSKADSDGFPVMFNSLTSPSMSTMELSDFARRYLSDPLGAVPGVANVRVNGARDYSMRIWLNRGAMAARGVTVQDIESALRTENTELPAGRIESGQREFTVRTNTRLNTPTQFQEIVLAKQGDALVRLGDVARVEIGPLDDRSESRLNGKPGLVMLNIIRQSTANTLDVSRGVREVIEQLRPTLPAGMTLNTRHDESVFIDSSIHEIVVAIGLAIVLVVVVILGFLRNLRATIIPVVAIPVSIISAMAVLAVLGFSLNVLTLLAFVLAVGLVVDDAIIVVENASRRIEEGEPPLLASYRGARQIGFAVIATTLVLISVVLPLAALEGFQGKLLREFAVALVAALLFSCLVALTLSPMLCSLLLREVPRHTRLFDITERWFKAVAGFYGRQLDRAMRVPRLVAGLMAVCVVAAAVLYGVLPKELAPAEDKNFFRIGITAPEGATLDYTRQEVQQVEDIILPYVQKGEVADFTSNINGGFGANGVNKANVLVRLVPWDQRSRSVKQIADEMRPHMTAIPGSSVALFISGGAGGGGFNQISFVLGGNSFEELAQWRDTVIERLANSGLVEGLEADYVETKPQLRVEVQRKRAADLGIRISDIGATLQTMMGGRQVTRYLDRGEEYDVFLQSEDADRANPRDLSNIYIRGTHSDQLIPLANLIAVTDTAGATELNRYNRQRSVTITGQLVPGVSMGEAIDAVEAAVTEVLPSHAKLWFEGSARQQIEASQSILFAFGMALLVAFLVLSAQFENFRLPAIVLVAAPMALLGGLLSVALAGLTLNIYTQVGMILLIGIVAKNAILIVEFANQLRDQGLDVRQSVRESCMIRLRPILMTSIATLFGALPLALATGAGSEVRQAVGWVIAGGIAVGTLLSLFVTPVLYLMFAGTVRPIGAIHRRLVKLDAEHRPAGAPAE